MFLNGFKVEEKVEEEKEGKAKLQLSATTPVTPVDWRSKGVVNPV